LNTLADVQRSVASGTSTSRSVFENILAAWVGGTYIRTIGDYGAVLYGPGGGYNNGGSGSWDCNDLYIVKPTGAGVVCELFKESYGGPVTNE
jgi:hypothetical protein